MGKLRMIGLVTVAAAFFVLAGQGLTSAATVQGASAAGPDAGTPSGLTKDKDAGGPAASAEKDSGARMLVMTERDSGTNP